MKRQPPHKMPEFRGGYTPLPNLIVERVLLKVPLPAYEFRVLLAVMRLTWGWGRAWEHSSFRELAKMTGIGLRHVQRAVASLVEKKVLVTGPGKRKTRFEVNPDCATWELSDEHSRTPLERAASHEMDEAEFSLMREKFHKEMGWK